MLTLPHPGLKMERIWCIWISPNPAGHDHPRPDLSSVSYMLSSIRPETADLACTCYAGDGGGDGQAVLLVTEQGYKSAGFGSGPLGSESWGFLFLDFLDFGGPGIFRSGSWGVWVLCRGLRSPFVSLLLWSAVFVWWNGLSLLQDSQGEGCFPCLAEPVSLAWVTNCFPEEGEGKELILGWQRAA